VSLRSAIEHWGSTAEERAAPYPCDAWLGPGARAVFRAIDIAAPAPLVFRWLCQIQVAPYSYDWIDNLGRRSPRQLTPGLDCLEVGQRFLIFRLVHFEPDRSVTLESTTWAFGHVVLTYAVRPVDERRSRLVVKLGQSRREGVLARVADALLPAGDLVMMRKQLLTLQRLAERDARTESGAV
jgi:hypothetical protein